MAPRAPNYFDELPRMRQSAALYNPSYDYRYIIRELRKAANAHQFIGISPQNVVRGMPLLPVIASRKNRDLRFFVDPVIVRQSGVRLRYEACGNIYLLRHDRKWHLDTLTSRPTRITLSYRDEYGQMHVETFTDTSHHEHMRNGFIGVICHEIDHLRGRLIADVSERVLLWSLDQIKKAKSREEHNDLLEDMPFALVRKGDEYELKFGAEFMHEPVPEMSPDAIFFSPGLFGGHWIAERIDEFRVPRGGEKLPIRLSPGLKLLVER